MSWQSSEFLCIGCEIGCEFRVGRGPRGKRFEFVLMPYAENVQCPFFSTSRMKLKTPEQLEELYERNKTIL